MDFEWGTPGEGLIDYVEINHLLSMYEDAGKFIFATREATEHTKKVTTAKIATQLPPTDSSSWKCIYYQRNLATKLTCRHEAK